MDPKFVKHLTNSLMGRRFGEFFRLFNAFAELQMYQIYRRKYHIAESFGFNGNDIILSGGGEIVLGERSYIGRNSIIRADAGTRFVAGRDCRLSYDIYAATSNYDHDQYFTNKQ